MEDELGRFTKEYKHVKMRYYNLLVCVFSNCDIKNQLYDFRYFFFTLRNPGAWCLVWKAVSMPFFAPGWSYAHKNCTYPF